MKVFESLNWKMLNDSEFGAAYLKNQGDKIKLINDEIYLYNVYSGLWCKTSKPYTLLKKEIKIELNKSLINEYKTTLNNFLHQTTMSEYKKAEKLFEKINNKVNSDTGINAICNTVIIDIADQNIKHLLDADKIHDYHINFKNGIYNIQSGIFRAREPQDFITKCLSWDYIDINPQFDDKDEEKEKKLKEFEKIKDKIIDIQQKVIELEQFYKKIQPDEIQFKFMLNWLSFCLTGASNQHFKFNIGYSASNGKSTEFQIHANVFDIYSLELNKETFNKDFTKRHKQFARLEDNPVRFAFIEELDTKKLDENEIKKFVDSNQINNEVLFGYSKTIINKAKLSTCSNNDPNLNCDRGIKRRATIQFYNSQFLDEEDLENHIYKKIDNYDKNFIYDDNYKLAYFYLLMKYKPKNLKFIPEINKNQFNELALEFDPIETILSDKFEITKNKNHELAKEDIESIFKDHNISFRNVLNKLKSKGIVYDRMKRIKDKEKRGCFYGMKEIEEKKNDDESEYDSHDDE